MKRSGTNVQRRAFVAGLGALVAGCGSGDATLIEASDGPEVTSRYSLYPKFNDSNPQDWPGRTPQTYPIHGIDVSRYQGTVDWKQVQKSGVSFAFLKATEGGDLLDPMFKTYWKESKRARVHRSAYHFYYFCRPAVDQARWFIKNVPRDRQAMPHVLDMEWNPFSPTCTLRPDGATVRAEARRFLDLLEAHYGRRPIVYSTIDFFRDTGIGRLRRTDFWLRAVADHPTTAYGTSNWLIWQYTATGQVPGISGPVDLNAFRGSVDAWKKWLS